MSVRRMARINELLLQEISTFVVERQDPEIGFVTFTGVQVSPDLAQGQVFYSVLGDEDTRARTAHALNHLRHELMQHMRRLESLRRLPILTFVYDDTPARAARVGELIEHLHQETPPHP